MKYTYEPAKKQLDEYLKEHGLKQTNERSEILKLICTYARPFTAKQVQNDISSVLAVSVATIYNTLRLFQNANLVSISRRQKEEQSAEADRYNKNTERQVYYEVALGSKNTMIFICSRCGKELMQFFPPTNLFSNNFGRAKEEDGGCHKSRHRSASYCHFLADTNLLVGKTVSEPRPQSTNH